MFLYALGFIFLFIITYLISILISFFIKDDFEEGKKFLFRKEKRDTKIFVIVLLFVVGVFYDLSFLSLKNKVQDPQQCIILKASDGGEAMYEKVK